MNSGSLVGCLENQQVRFQARITLPQAMREKIDPLRLQWNPQQAQGNPAHITIIYHDEAPDLNLLLDRLKEFTSACKPFPIELGAAQQFPAPDCGAFLSVTDSTQSIQALRQNVLAAPFTQRSRFGLHTTMLHPKHGEHLRTAWPAICSLPSLGQFVANEVQVVDYRNETVAVFSLADTSR